MSILKADRWLSACGPNWWIAARWLSVVLALAAGCERARTPSPPAVPAAQPAETGDNELAAKLRDQLAALDTKIESKAFDTTLLCERALLKRKLAILDGNPAPRLSSAMDDVQKALGAASGSAQARPLIEGARVCLVADDRDRYAEFVERAAAIDPGNPDVRIELARRVGIVDQDWAAAEQQLLQLTKEPALGRSADCWMALGLACMGLEKTAAARSAFAKVLKIDPDSPAARRNLAMIDLGGDAAAHAKILGKPASQITQAEAFTINNRGAALLGQKRYDEAARVLEPLVQKLPTFPAARLNLGSAYDGLKRFDDAIAQYQEAIRLVPNSADLHRNLALCFANAGRHAEAVGAFQNAARLKPNDPTIDYEMANSLSQLRRFDEAEAAYRRALQRSPQDPRPYNNLGMMLADLFRFDESAACLRTAAELRPDDAKYPQNLARVLHRAGRAVEAEKWARTALEKTGESGFALNLVAVSVRDQGRVAEARALFERAMAADPKFGLAAGNLADLEREAGHLDVARGLFQRTLEAEPSNDYVFRRYLRLLLETGAADEARRAVARQMAANPDNQAFPTIELDLLRALGRSAEALEKFTAHERGQLDGGGLMWRGWLHFEAGQLEDAAADLAAASKLDPHNGYIALARWSILRARGETSAADAVLRDARREHGEREWIGKLIRAVAGEIDPEALTASLTAPEQRCEACYYVAEKLLADGNVTAAQQWYQKCVKAGALEYFEHQAATWRLLQLSR
jgi:tetratricopeptide (TPR) repeat protein